VADLNLPVSRRSLLLGAAGLLGGTALLAACGGSDGDSPTGASTGTAGGTTGSAASSDQFLVAPRFPNTKAFTAGPVRLPISLTHADASLLVTGPDRLTGVVRDEGGSEVGTIDAVRRGTGLSVPYWSIVTTLPKTGLYELSIDGALGDPTSIMTYDAADITMPIAGRALPGFDTPTVDDARGVDPICTRAGQPCPFHAVTLNEALQMGKPVIYMVGTPAHCQFATCGPGLEFLIAASATYGDRITIVHAEVYADPEATTVAPAIEALTLQYEPVMFFTDAQGVVTNRVDIVWDEADLDELLRASFS
jgi:hypothetical protein